MTDVFHWEMSAANHKGSVDALVHEIKEAHHSQSPLPIRVILDLLPLQVADPDALTSKGDGTFEIQGDSFQNVSDDEVVSEFFDPVLQDHTITFPAIMAGKLDVSPDGGLLVVSFQPPLEMEIPRLADLGVQRSMFQWITQITLTDESSVTVLKDKADEDLETWVDAELVTPRTKALSVPATVQSISTLGVSGSCNSDPDDPNWYVYQRRDNLCLTHYGRIAVGGQLAYRLRAGPGTKSQMDQFMNANCNPTC
ncbi:MAG: hypothetical protein AAF683_01350 [Pseudomonadota bacterium]